MIIGAFVLFFQTYIVDQRGSSSAVIFTLDQEISAFSSGFYSVGNKKMPVLVYATFTGMIYLYYNISDYYGIKFVPGLFIILKFVDFADRQIRRLVFHPHGQQMAPATRNLVSDLLYNHQNNSKAKTNDIS